MAVLKSFSSDKAELSPAEIATRVRVPKPTVYRVLSTLSHGGFLEQNSATGKYRIGPALYALGSLYLDTTDVLKAAESTVKTLNDLTSEALNVGILDEGNLVIVMKEESKHPFRLSVHIGSSMPAYTSAMGKALLSEFSDAELDILYPAEELKSLTPKTLKTKSELKRELSETRKNGVAFSREESYEGFIGVGALIRNASREAVAAISISVPTFRFNQSYSKRLSGLIKMAADLVSYRLGYQNDHSPVHDLQEISSFWQKSQNDKSFSEEVVT